MDWESMPGLPRFFWGSFVMDEVISRISVDVLSIFKLLWIQIAFFCGLPRHFVGGSQSLPRSWITASSPASRGGAARDVEPRQLWMWWFDIFLSLCSHLQYNYIITPWFHDLLLLDSTTCSSLIPYYYKFPNFAWNVRLVRGFIWHRISHLCNKTHTFIIEHLALFVPSCCLRFFC